MLDWGVFFMSCIRDVTQRCEAWCGVRPEVSQAIRALHDASVGRYETAHGLSSTFRCLHGCPQGCSQSPTRSRMVLRLVQEAVTRLCKGFKFAASRGRIPQIWFCDDAVFMAEDLAGVQLALDTGWMVARIAGLDMQVKSDGSKTAWQGSYWEGGVERQVTGWRLRLPDGKEVPQVASYKHLGSPETATWSGGQDGARKKVVEKCKQMIGAIGRLGVLREDQLRMAMTLAVEGLIGYYARCTALRMEDCDGIEAAREAVLKARGFAAGAARVCMHVACTRQKRRGGRGTDTRTSVRWRRSVRSLTSAWAQGSTSQKGWG